MIKCPNCGNEVNEDDFCSKCGFKLRTKQHTLQDNKQHCPNCGFKTSIRDEFCQKCGARIKGKSNNKVFSSFNKTSMIFPLVLGIVPILILLSFPSKILFVICLFVAGFLFGLKSNNALINSILFAVIPAIFFIILIQSIAYLLMCFIPSIIGCYLASKYIKRRQ